MSASPLARSINSTSGHQEIPSRRVVIATEEDMPADYSTTPGGTIFGTTPGGTRIVYERAFLINMRNSPMARTPPKNLPYIPGVTVDFGNKDNKVMENNKTEKSKDEQNSKEEDDQFSMDI